jgi:hypothetical protein
MAATLDALRIKKAAHQERIVDASDQSENPEWQQPSTPSASKSSASGTDRGRFRPI